MKKIVLLILIIVTVLLVGCRDSSERAFDFRSIACTKTGAVLSLGDEKPKFDEVFGEGEHLGYGLYGYLDRALEVGFESGKATGLQFNTHSHTDRIAFYNVNLDMTAQEVIDNFTPSEFVRDDGIFNRFFDAKGNRVPQEESAYTLTVAYFDPFGIIYVVLRQN